MFVADAGGGDGERGIVEGKMRNCATETDRCLNVQILSTRNNASQNPKSSGFPHLLNRSACGTRDLICAAKVPARRSV